MIDIKPPKREYWQNIYVHGSLIFYGIKFGSREACQLQHSYNSCPKPAFRIHVVFK